MKTFNQCIAESLVKHQIARLEIEKLNVEIKYKEAQLMGLKAETALQTEVIADVLYSYLKLATKLDKQIKSLQKEAQL